ncbi:MAG: hypothetical protein ABGX16_00325 [Pirellulales bacterium]
MTCIHLRELYQLCQNEKLKLSSSDLIHIVCQKCGEQEVCPSLLTQEVPEEETSPDETADHRLKAEGSPPVG